jgi:hypothetical protein
VSRNRLLWLAVALAVVVAYQVVVSSSQRSAWFVAQADVPTVAPGVDVLAGLSEVPVRIRGYDYRRAAFGDAWTDDNDAPGGHNGCDTRFLGGSSVLHRLNPNQMSPILKPG